MPIFDMILAMPALRAFSRRDSPSSPASARAVCNASHGHTRAGAIADQHGCVVHVAAVAGFERESNLGAQASLDQRVMHRAGGHRHRNRQQMFAGGAVGHQQDADAAADQFDGLLLQVPKTACLSELSSAKVQFKCGERKFLVQRIGAFMQRRHLPERKERRGQHESGQGRVLVEQMRPRAQARAQRHHASFAQRIDGRIGDLREALAEESVQRARRSSPEAAIGVSSPIDQMASLLSSAMGSTTIFTSSRV